MNVFGQTLAVAGALVLLVAALGLQRFGDVYMRASAVATGTGVGISFVLVGAVLVAPGVADVRALGAIGVLELEEPCDVAATQKLLVEQGVWIRPFGKLVYIMPPYGMEPDDLSQLTRAMAAVAEL